MSAELNLIAAVRKLVKAKGRYHTEQNYMALVAALDAYDVGIAAGGGDLPPPESALEDLMHRHGLIGVAGDNPALEAKLIAFARAAVDLNREQQGEPVARLDLLIQVDNLCSQIENTLYAFRDDYEAVEQAKGAIEHAKKVAAPYRTYRTATFKGEQK